MKCQRIRLRRWRTLALDILEVKNQPERNFSCGGSAFVYERSPF
jgi:hypothetical protein